jgi:DNA repair protein RecO (recombination protein O)
MLLKTRCIVLRQIPYSDNAIIVHVYTRESGRMAFMARISKSKTAKLRKNLFQPLFLLEIEYSNKNSRDLQQISEAVLNPLLHTIPINPNKNATALFLSEILYLCLKEEEGSSQLYDFLENSIKYFDLQEINSNDFHVIFLSKLLKYIGFSPLLLEGDKNYFDIQNGIFTLSKPLSHIYLNPEETKVFIACLSLSFSEIPDLSKLRKPVLTKIVDYYKIHLLTGKEPKSLAVLQEVFG